eukprot:s1031_g24.t1
MVAKPTGGSSGHRSAWSQWSTSSTTSWSQPSKGSGKGELKGSDDKSKSKGKGKGKGKEPVLCFNCRPGHVAKDCWRVKQVGNSETATVVTSVNGRESVGPSASANLTLKRVSALPERDFDLRNEDVSSSSCIRMVKFFYINNGLEEPTSAKSATLMDGDNKYELENEEVNIIIGSGADAPIFPASMAHCGQDHGGAAVALQDAQGRQIPVLGHKTMSVLLEDVGATEIAERQCGLFS